MDVIYTSLNGTSITMQSAIADMPKIDLIQLVKDHLLEELRTNRSLNNGRVTFIEEFLYMLPSKITAQNGSVWTFDPDRTPVQEHRRPSDFVISYTIKKATFITTVKFSINEVFTADELLKYVRGVYVDIGEINCASGISTYVDTISDDDHRAHRRMNDNDPAYRYHTTLIDLVGSFVDALVNYEHRPKYYRAYIARVIGDIVCRKNLDDPISRAMALAFAFATFMVRTNGKNRLVIDHADRVYNRSRIDRETFLNLYLERKVPQLKLSMVDEKRYNDTNFVSVENSVRINLSTMYLRPWDSAVPILRSIGSEYQRLADTPFAIVVEDIFSKVRDIYFDDDTPVSLGSAPKFVRRDEPTPDVDKKPRATRKPRAKKQVETTPEIADSTTTATE